MDGSSTDRALRGAAVALLVAAMAAGLAWQLTGGRWQIVSSPSMGTAAPVGTVVLTRPTATVEVGDIVTFRPPGGRDATVTHRVVAVDGPTFRTRGDLNGADDPAVLRASDLVGEVVAVGHGLGWLVRALPVLVAGTALLWWTTRRFLSRMWAVPVRVLGLSLLLGGTAAVLRPFVGTVTRATVAEGGDTHLSLVSTGLLPIRVRADTGGTLDLVSGQAGVLTTPLPAGARGVDITSGLHMPVWLWVLMTGVWLLPMLYGLVSAWRRPLVDEGPTDPDPPTEPIPVINVVSGAARRRRPVPVGVATLAVVVSLFATTTSAAFTARITNPQNTAGSAPYFTCAGAVTGIGGTVIAWPLDDASVANGATARTLSGTRTGTYTNTFSTTTDKPCPRDTPARAVTLAPTATATAPSSVAMNALLPALASPNVFSLAIWFRTTTTTGGRLMGWGNLRTGTSTTYDRHLYMTDSGTVVFGVYPNAYKIVTSPASYNDGAWHLAVATLSGAGMELYLDGARVASDPGTTTGEGGLLNTGYWRVGYDNLATWPASPTTTHWTGSLSQAAVFGSALSAEQVRALARAGR